MAVRQEPEEAPDAPTPEEGVETEQVATDADPEDMMYLLRKARLEMHNAQRTLVVAQMAQNATKEEARLLYHDPMHSEANVQLNDTDGSVSSATQGKATARENADSAAKNLDGEYTGLLRVTADVQSATASSVELKQEVMRAQEAQRIADARESDAELVDRLSQTSMDLEQGATATVAHWNEAKPVESALLGKQNAIASKESTSQLVEDAKTSENQAMVMLNQSVAAAAAEREELKLSKLHLSKTWGRLEKAEIVANHTGEARKTLRKRLKAAKERAKSTELAAKQAKKALSQLFLEGKASREADETLKANQTVVVAEQAKAVTDARVAVANLKLAIAEGDDVDSAMSDANAKISHVLQLAQQGLQDSHAEMNSVSEELDDAETELATIRSHMASNSSSSDVAIAKQQEQIADIRVQYNAANAQMKINKVLAARVWRTRKGALDIDQSEYEAPVFAEIEAKAQLTQAKKAVRAASKRRNDFIETESQGEAQIHDLLHNAESKRDRLKREVAAAEQRKQAADKAETDIQSKTAQEIQSSVGDLARAEGRREKRYLALKTQQRAVYEEIQKLNAQEKKKEEDLQEMEVTDAEEHAKVKGEANEAKAEDGAAKDALQLAKDKDTRNQQYVRSESEALKRAEAKATTYLKWEQTRDIQDTKDAIVKAKAARVALDREVDENKADLNHTETQMTWAQDQEKKSMSHLSGDEKESLEKEEQAENAVVEDKQEMSTAEAEETNEDSKLLEANLKRDTDAIESEEQQAEELTQQVDEQSAWINVTQEKLKVLEVDEKKRKDAEAAEQNRLEARVAKLQADLAESKDGEEDLQSKIRQVKAEEPAKQATALKEAKERLETVASAESVLKAQDAAEQKSLQRAQADMDAAEKTLNQVAAPHKPAITHLEETAAEQSDRVAALKESVDDDSTALNKDKAAGDKEMQASKAAADAAEQEMDKVLTEGQIQLREDDQKAEDARSAYTEAHHQLKKSEEALKDAKKKSEAAEKRAAEAEVNAKEDDVQVRAAKKKVKELEKYIDDLESRKERAKQRADADIAKMREESAALSSSDSTMEEKIRIRKDASKREVASLEAKLDGVREQKSQLEAFFKQIDTKNKALTSEGTEMDLREQRAASIARQQADQARKTVEQTADLVRQNKAGLEKLREQINDKVEKMHEDAKAKETKTLAFRSKDDAAQERALTHQAEEERDHTLSSLDELAKIQAGRVKEAQNELKQATAAQEARREKTGLYAPKDQADEVVQDQLPESKWEQWTCPSDPTQKASAKVQTSGVCGGWVVMSTEGVEDLDAECSMAWSAFVSYKYGKALLDYATSMQGCTEVAQAPSELSIPAIQLLTALEADYRVKGKAAADNVDAHEEAEALLARANTIERNLERHPAAGEAAGKHLSSAIVKAKQAMSKVIEAHNELHHANGDGTPTLKLKRQWSCSSDLSTMEQTTHFDKPCDSFVSVTSSVGSGVANRFAGVFLVDASGSQLEGECRTELMTEVAFRFGTSLQSERTEFKECKAMREVSSPVLKASMGLRDATARKAIYERQLGDAVSAGDTDHESLTDMDASIASAKATVQMLVEQAQDIAQKAAKQTKDSSASPHDKSRALKAVRSAGRIADEANRNIKLAMPHVKQHSDIGDPAFTEADAKAERAAEAKEELNARIHEDYERAVHHEPLLMQAPPKNSPFQQKTGGSTQMTANEKGDFKHGAERFGPMDPGLKGYGGHTGDVEASLFDQGGVQMLDMGA